MNSAEGTPWLRLLRGSPVGLTIETKYGAVLPIEETTLAEGLSCDGDGIGKREVGKDVAACSNMVDAVGAIEGGKADSCEGTDAVDVDSEALFEGDSDDATVAFVGKFSDPSGGGEYTGALKDGLTTAGLVSEVACEDAEGSDSDFDDGMNVVGKMSWLFVDGVDTGGSVGVMDTLAINFAAVT